MEGASVYIDGILKGTTNEYGRLTINDVTIGNHVLEARNPSFYTFKDNIPIKSEYAEEEEIILSRKISKEPKIKEQRDDSRESSLKKVDESTLRVEVKYDTGFPVQNAGIYLKGSSSKKELVGKTDGKGVFKATMPIGKYTLRVEKEGYSPGTDEGKGIELTEYYAEERKITLKRIPVIAEKTVTGKNILPKEQEKPKEAVKAPAAVKDKKTITSADNKSTDAKDASKPEGDIFLTVKVFEDTGSGRLPVRNAKILIDGGLCGETDENGLFRRKLTPGECKLRVEKEGFKPEYKMFKLSSHSDIREIALKKIPPVVVKRKDDYYIFIIIGSIVGTLGFIALGVIIFTKKKGGKKETIFIDSMGDEHAESKIQKIHVRFKPFKYRKGMSLIYLGKNPFNVRQKVVFKVLKEEHHNEDGLWLFNNEKKVHQILKNNGANKNQNHLAQYLYSGFLARNKKQRIIAFEYIEGVSLADIIIAKKHTLRQAIEMGIWICDPVMAVHYAGYCHLDLKPEHFIYKEQNRFTLIDIATALRINDSVMTIFKSPPYSSPEQLKPRSVIDQRTDIYSLGVIIEELIHSSTIGYLNSTLISSVQSIIGVMKNENRDARYRHITEVKASLEMLLRSFVNG